ncbi:MAG: acyl-CoA dehydrogenase, partial [Acidimicrobiia bacterium]
MEFGYSPEVEELRGRLLAFMEEWVYPSEAVYERQIDESGDPHRHPQVIEELKKEARGRGLWNLFLPDSELGA